MTQTTVPPVRARARALAVVVAVLAVTGLAAACAQTKRSLGDACLKSEDCLSGICSQLVCVGEPPLTDVESTADSGLSASDATSGSDAAPEAAEEAAVEAASEAAPAEAGGD